MFFYLGSDETPDAILSKKGVTVKAWKESYIFNMCPLEDQLTPRPLRKISGISVRREKGKPRKKEKKTGVSELYFLHQREQIPHTLTQALSSTAAGFWSVSVSVKLCHLDLQVQKIEERHFVLSLNVNVCVFH